MTSEASDTSAAGSPPAADQTTTTTSDKTSSQNKKRSDSNATDPNSSSAKVTKRRAARACVSCRARKVRCNVVEESPCTNCRFDNVECVVQESRRRKKHLVTANSAGPDGQHRCQSDVKQQPLGFNKQSATNYPVAITSAAELDRPKTASPLSNDLDTPVPAGVTTGNGSSGSTSGIDGHMPHMIYQRLGYQSIQPSTDNTGSRSQPQSQQQQSQHQQQGWSTPTNPNLPQNLSGTHNRTAQFLKTLEYPDPGAQLPAFVRPLPARIAAEDVAYLQIKGALTLPSIPLQNALLQAYVEYVHPYMPLTEIHEFLNIVNRRDGVNGQLSLFLYHAVMFSATAFVDMSYLREAGYSTRKAARKSFFQKTRLLYDFDYEMDRLVLVQALLLMTYWYETPDDQKDTWHWMGVAISLAHTIGLHRDPGSTTMAVHKQKLWKRIWWSCFMRDRLVALGMRRPTRIKDEDFDVPMLEEDDFEIQPLADNITVIPPECALMRDVGMQRDLAVMCIAKAKLCLCISHMLKAQYSVLIRDNVKPENTTNSTMMLFPNKQLDNVENVNTVDMELMAWAESLPTSCQYRTLTPGDMENGRATLAVQRTLLHMVYYTTISALHRPQFLPSSPAHAPTASRQAQEMSRIRVREAATRTTRMAAELHHFRLEKFLPTTGVTVILPAMIIHLLEMKNPVGEARDRATKGFRQCMRVMEKLRELYAAADYATGFLDAALRKASIDIHANIAPSTLAMMKRMPVEFSAQTPPPENVPYMTASESLFNEKVSAQNASAAALANASAPEQLRRAAMAPLQTISAADLDLSVTGATSPPNTDLGSGFTPSASGGSEEAGFDFEQMDLDFMQNHDEFDWNAVTGTDFDVDQWLQFPPEGVNGGAGDDIMNGVTAVHGGDDAVMTSV